MARRHRTLLKSLPFSQAAYKKIVRAHNLYCCRQQIRKTDPIRVILGAASTTQEGWISTDLDLLDITSSWDWFFLFKPNSIRNLLMEHVLEHLTIAECEKALKKCYQYLSPEGLMRIAVPDGYRRDAAYVAEVSPPRDGHKILLNVDTLVPLLEGIGFQVSVLEYFDRDGDFRAVDWNPADGYIARSKRFDRQEAFKIDNLFYTSLIVDARKKSA